MTQTEQKIIDQVCEDYAIDFSELIGSARCNVYLEARKRVVNELMALPYMTYCRIGEMLGGRDHSTIIHIKNYGNN